MQNINENPSHSKSQAEKILDYMLSGKAITPIEALDLFGCFRLSARIADIKAKGYLVYSESVIGNDGKKFKKYYL